MPRDWESTFASWIGRASDAEQDRYEWTLREVSAALQESPRISKYSYALYAKGSYPNFTNVVRDSDVDVAVEIQDMFNYRFSGSAQGMTAEEAQITPYTGSLTLAGFKDDVQAALTSRFGSKVNRGSKALHVRESERGLAADVVPCQTHRLYRQRSPWGYDVGILLRDDNNPTRQLVNFPKQHLKEGQAKNDSTSRRYKRVVRILKRLENEMVDKGETSPVPSFLIESATWNIPNHFFNFESTWLGQVRHVLARVYEGCKDSSAESSDSWLEANGIKFLFHPTQTWDRSIITDFSYAAWNYIGLG